MNRTLANTCANKYGFIYKKFAKTISQFFQIKASLVITAQYINFLKERYLIYYLCYLSLINYCEQKIESFASFLITKLQICDIISD